MAVTDGDSTQIHKGMWYRYNCKILNKGIWIKRKWWVKAEETGDARRWLEYTCISPVAPLGLKAYSTLEEKSYFTGASFEKAEILENQLRREREMRGNTYGTF